ncbi:unnamed protein product [Ostreobium quekettii]|uniref:Uncharacterized protein n=1 Tax=Ostreobium quekettii TaxID=121088 RepID=A0A8S1JB48_9CHLO|nr:unnamed protein product [Ostreobium quekettii]
MERQPLMTVSKEQQRVLHSEGGEQGAAQGISVPCVAYVSTRPSGLTDLDLNVHGVCIWTVCMRTHAWHRLISPGAFPSGEKGCILSVLDKCSETIVGKAVGRMAALSCGPADGTCCDEYVQS